MKLEIASAMLALEAQDAVSLSRFIFEHFGVQPIELKAVHRGTGVPRAGIIVIPDKCMSYAFGELGGPSGRYWGFSNWSFNIKDRADYPYLLFT